MTVCAALVAKPLRKSVVQTRSLCFSNTLGLSALSALDGTSLLRTRCRFGVAGLRAARVRKEGRIRMGCRGPLYAGRMDRLMLTRGCKRPLILIFDPLYRSEGASP